jgi:hypothetical protein
MGREDDAMSGGKKEKVVGGILVALMAVLVAFF